MTSPYLGWVYRSSDLIKIAFFVCIGSVLTLGMKSDPKIATFTDLEFMYGFIGVVLAALFFVILMTEMAYAIVSRMQKKKNARSWKNPVRIIYHNVDLVELSTSYEYDINGCMVLELFDCNIEEMPYLKQP